MLRMSAWCACHTFVVNVLVAIDVIVVTLCRTRMRKMFTAVAAHVSERRVRRQLLVDGARRVLDATVDLSLPVALG